MCNFLEKGVISLCFNVQLSISVQLSGVLLAGLTRLFCLGGRFLSVKISFQKSFVFADA